MANFRNYNFDQSEVAAIALDTTNGHFLWIAFVQKDGACLLKKVAAHDLSQTYFSISVPVTSINAICVFGSNIYVAVTDSTYAIYVYNLSTPFTSYSLFTKAELSLTEAPIEITSDATNIYFLTAGVSDTAQIVQLDSYSFYITTIDLIESGLEIRNAVSFTIDASSNLWVVVSAIPGELYRVFLQSGSWQLQRTELP